MSIFYTAQLLEHGRTFLSPSPQKTHSVLFFKADKTAKWLLLDEQRWQESLVLQRFHATHSHWEVTANVLRLVSTLGGDFLGLKRGSPHLLSFFA